MNGPLPIHEDPFGVLAAAIWRAEFAHASGRPVEVFPEPLDELATRVLSLYRPIARA